ncbi:MAG: Hsp20/alpha crystallin family protein [Desulfobacter sp.]|nr:Hsp20/alpha crystallin family protein [Desulfobacter sp.]WDP86307.1 MAG: Hsp20/alpha crystallin family protein [Desulfobacter sp.]
MDLPGVKKENVSIKLEKNILEVEGRIDYLPYEKLNPVYTEYNIGNYARKFTVSHAVDTSNIDAVLKDGVLTLALLKVPEAEPRQIPIK